MDSFVSYFLGSLHGTVVCLQVFFAALGPRLEKLELLELALASDRWYKAHNSEDVQAVIGIAKGEKILPEEESRKRRRMD